ncbi:hypothetical protein L1987_08163 [Smallanthus sonchifolius]|uniref:Uncharacterized protein n=1 Tax=Smallanthus sonchifolius TaxID=185202 RepID=A0ACB9JLI0_9ASTR|nr:hypothetical protein L1987_08163 [Smallanthus sonchifolius]
MAFGPCLQELNYINAKYNKSSYFVAIRHHCGHHFLIQVDPLVIILRNCISIIHGVITSPHRRTQTTFSSSSSRKNYTAGNELGSFSTVIRRHRFLLTALALLAFLCTIYLYFAITLGGGGDLCSGLTGTQKALCQVQHVKQSVAKGKLKFI